MKASPEQLLALRYVADHLGSLRDKVVFLEDRIRGQSPDFGPFVGTRYCGGTLRDWHVVRGGSVAGGRVVTDAGCGRSLR